MKNFKNFIAGFISATILFGTLTVGASTNATIDVVFDAIRVVAEGRTVENTILYDGTTYVPLRQAGELFGKEVTFNAETKTAYIGEVPMKSNSTIDKPVSMGHSETVEVNDWGYNYKLDVTIEEVMYKDLANEIMQEANSFNKVTDGYEPIIVKVTARNLQSEEPIDVSDYSFEVICNGATIEEQSFVDPKPAFESTIYPGGEFTGYIIYQIPINQDAVLRWKHSNSYFAIK